MAPRLARHQDHRIFIDSSCTLHTQGGGKKGEPKTKDTLQELVD